MFTDGRIEGAQFGQRVFILQAIAFLAIRFLGAGRLVAGLNFVEREHRHEMFHALEFFTRRATDALRGRFRRDEVGKILFQLLNFREQRVVFAIADLLPTDDVISVVMPADLGGEFGVSFLGSSVCHAGNFNAKTQRSKVTKVKTLCLAALR